MPMTEFQQIKKRQKDIYYTGYWLRYEDEVYHGERSLALCEEDDTYFYPDVNYHRMSRSSWEAASHYLRLDYQIITEGRKRLENDAEWRKKLLGAIRYWIKRDYINPNWWYNQIGAPQVLINLALALEGFIPDDIEEGLKKIVLRGIFRAHEGVTEIEELKSTTKFVTADAWTGANLIWGAATTIKYALWIEDEKLLRIAVDRLAREIDFAREGVQADGAFCQHGPRWYSGGYGRSFVYELAPIIRILSGTSFSLPREKLDILLLHVLDGQRAMMKNASFDFSAVGREYTRAGTIGAGPLTKAIGLLKDSDGIPRHAELNDFYNELILGKDDHEITKYYESIAQLCHKKNGVYIGIRGRTEGLFGAEICNDEGVLSYNMTYGTVTCIMQSGKEYFDISPFWDYSKIPGTTSRSEDDEALETPCRAYGKADKDSGILTEKAVHDGITLMASFFAFEGAMAALGTDIKDETPEKGQLFTTVEQCRASSAEIAENRVKCGKLTYRNLDKNTSFISSLETRKGSWSRNNLSSSKEILEDSILTITIPVTDRGKYGYLVFGEKEVQVEILRNDIDCQAILANGKKLMAVFHNDASLTVNGRRIEGKKGDIILN